MAIQKNTNTNLKIRQEGMTLVLTTEIHFLADIVQIDDDCCGHDKGGKNINNGSSSQYHVHGGSKDHASVVMETNSGHNQDKEETEGLSHDNSDDANNILSEGYHGDDDDDDDASLQWLLQQDKQEVSQAIVQSKVYFLGDISEVDVNVNNNRGSYNGESQSTRRLLTSGCDDEGLLDEQDPASVATAASCASANSSRTFPSSSVTTCELPEVSSHEYDCCSCSSMDDAVGGNMMGHVGSLENLPEEDSQDDFFTNHVQISQTTVLAAMEQRGSPTSLLKGSIPGFASPLRSIVICTAVALFLFGQGWLMLGAGAFWRKSPIVGVVVETCPVAVKKEATKNYIGEGGATVDETATTVTANASSSYSSCATLQL